jgi:hypothetical protein
MLWLAGSLATCLLVSRLALALPHTAVSGSQEAGLSRSWSATRGNAGRIRSGLALTAAPVIVFTIATASYLPDTPTRTGFVFVAIFHEILWATLGMVTVSFLSLVYRRPSAPVD